MFEKLEQLIRKADEALCNALSWQDLGEHYRANNAYSHCLTKLQQAKDELDLQIKVVTDMFKDNGMNVEGDDEPDYIVLADGNDHLPGDNE